MNQSNYLYQRISPWYIRYFSTVLLMCTICYGHAQTKEILADTSVIQFSGWVLTPYQGSYEPIPGVYIYIPKKGWGTVSNLEGFFSMAVPAGSEILFHTISFKDEHIQIPLGQKEDITLTVRLLPDTVQIDQVIVYPLPSEDKFKAQILALNIPTQYTVNLPQDVVNSIQAGNSNNYASDYIYLQSQRNRYEAVSFPFTDPIRWLRYIRSRKKKNKKQP